MQKARELRATGKYRLKDIGKILGVSLGSIWHVTKDMKMRVDVPRSQRNSVPS